MRLNLSKIFYRNLLIFSGLIAMLPNFGNFQAYNALRAIFCVYFLVISLGAYDMKFTGTIEKIRKSLVVILIFSFLVMFMHSLLLIYDIPYTLRDWSELYKPVYYYVLFIGWIFLLYKNYVLGNNILKSVLIICSVLSIYNLVVLWALKNHTVPFLEPWTPHYTIDGDLIYPQYVRPYGLPGQAGTTSIYCGILTTILLWINSETKKKLYKIITIIAVIANVIASLTTYSRIGFFFVIMAILFFVFQNTKRIMGYSVIIFIIFSYLSANFLNNTEYFDINKFTRDTDNKSITENRSVSSRLWNRKAASEAVLFHPVTAIFGYGPNKNLLMDISQMQDKIPQFRRGGQMWSTDSDYSIILIRWGFLGLILYFTPYIIMLVYGIRNWKKDNMTRFFTFFIFMMLFMVQLDPPFSDLRCMHIAYLFIALYMVHEGLGIKDFSNLPNKK